MNKSLIFSVMMLSTSYSHACINTYAIEFEVGMPSPEQIAERKSELQQKKLSNEVLNDLGVLQIYEGKYSAAIETFKKIEKMQPNLAITAANLGTAYELKGDFQKATYWIRKGMERDPNIHQGSEWIHLKILEAKKEQARHKDWIQHNDVLGLDFGSAEMPYAHEKSISYMGRNYDLNTILGHSIEQMGQRLPFIKYGEKEPLSAQIVMNIANIEMLNYNRDERTQQTLFEQAKRLGYTELALLEKRENYYLNSKWYAFKQYVVWAASDLKVKLNVWIAEIKQKYL